LLGLFSCLNMMYLCQYQAQTIQEEFGNMDEYSCFTYIIARLCQSHN
jgi:hypothetical protein